MKIYKRIVLIAAVLLTGMLVFAGCGKQEAEKKIAIPGLAVAANPDFGGIDIQISIEGLPISAPWREAA